MVTSGEAVALCHPPLKHTTAIPLPLTLVHCSEVKEKDMTCTGSEAKCCSTAGVRARVCLCV